MSVMSISIPIRSLSEIADDINQTLPGLENSDKMTGSEVEPDMISSSSSSFMCSKTDLLKAKELEALKIARQETYEKLKARKEELQQELLLKFSSLRELCLKEAELTGIIPPELPLTPGESLPHVRKRVGTTFVLSPKWLSNSEEDQMKKLEMEFEIQEKIMEAESQLAQDKSLPKSVRKKHRRTYRQAYQKVKELEGKINNLREQAGRERVVVNAQSLDDLSEDSREFLDDDTEPDPPATPSQGPVSAGSASQPQKPVHNYYRRYTHHELRYPSCGTPKADKAPSTPQFFSPEGSLNWSSSLGDDSSSSSSTIRFYPKKVVQISPSPRSSPCRVDTPSVMSGSSSRVRGEGSISSAQSSENQYQMHSFCPKRKQSGSSLGSDFSNSCSSSMSSLQQNSISEKEENLYNINTYLTSCYESGDELQTPAINTDEIQQWPTKHGSLDRRHSTQSRYDANCLSGSLELPELASLKFSGKDSATGYCNTTPHCEISQNSGGRLLRKNCSERSHHRRRGKLTEPDSCIIEQPVYQFPGNVNSPLISSPSEDQTVPHFHPAFHAGGSLDSKKFPKGFSAFRTDNPQQVAYSRGESTPAHPTVERHNSVGSEDGTSTLMNVLDSPEKLTMFRKERYGRSMAGSGRTPLPVGHNRDAVDALFRHNEESISYSPTAVLSPYVISTQTSSPMYQNSEIP